MKSGKADSLPSRFSLWLIKRVFADKTESKLGDFLEIYAASLEERGRIKTRLWFWRYLIRTIPKYLKDSLAINMTMLGNNLKITLRNLAAHKGSSLIKISGLVVGLASFILISLFVRYEFSFDRYHARSDRIYRVIQHQPEKNYINSDYFCATQGSLGPALMERFPEVESAVRLESFPHVLIFNDDKSFTEDNFFYADPQIFDVFDIPLLRGASRAALGRPHSVLISNRIAKKYFGNSNPVGEVLRHQNARDLLIAGVFEDMPSNSHFRMDFLASFKLYQEIQPFDAGKWTPGWYCKTYCLLKPGADPAALEQKLAALSAEVFKLNNIESRLVLQPLHRIHLFSNINLEFTANGSIRHVYLFSFVAFLILLIACINYMNLGTARSLRRGKEVGIRKVVGAHKSQLVAQFLGESIMITLVAFGLSLFLVRMILPAFNTFMERDIPFRFLGGMEFLIFLPALILLTGLASGSYPAFLLSSFKPITILRGSHILNPKGSFLRHTLVVFQFAVSITLFISTLVVRDQLKFISRKDVGFSKDQILVFNVRGRELRDNLPALKMELLNHPNILQAAVSNQLPNNITSFNRFEHPKHADAPLLTLYTSHVDPDFVELYDIEIVQGRNFSREFSSDERGAILINQAAARALEWESPVGQRLRHRSDRSPVVVGVLKDFNFHSLHNEIAPLCLYQTSTGYRLSLKIRGENIPETLSFIRSRMKPLTSYPVEHRFFDEVFARAYRAEQRMADLFTICALLAVFIACLGLIGLVTFTAEQRTREIGIRKVLGASVSSIFQLLTMQFLKWVLLANLISWPIAYITMHRWLRNFAFRTDLGVGPFAVSALFALGLALLTLSGKSIRAATADPIESLRYE